MTLHYHHSYDLAVVYVWCLLLLFNRKTLHHIPRAIILQWVEVVKAKWQLNTQSPGNSCPRFGYLGCFPSFPGHSILSDPNCLNAACRPADTNTRTHTTNSNILNAINNADLVLRLQHMYMQQFIYACCGLYCIVNISPFCTYMIVRSKKQNIAVKSFFVQ